MVAPITTVDFTLACASLSLFTFDSEASRPSQHVSSDKKRQSEEEEEEELRYPSDEFFELERERASKRRRLSLASCSDASDDDYILCTPKNSAWPHFEPIHVPFQSAFVKEDSNPTYVSRFARWSITSIPIPHHHFYPSISAPAFGSSSEFTFGSSSEFTFSFGCTTSASRFIESSSPWRTNFLMAKSNKEPPITYDIDAEDLLIAPPPTPILADDAYEFEDLFALYAPFGSPRPELNMVCSSTFSECGAQVDEGEEEDDYVLMGNSSFDMEEVVAELEDGFVFSMEEAQLSV